MQENLELQKAWRLVANTNKSLFLTGKAGTGKTTFLKRLRAKSPKRIVVAAPTGVAAINAEGVTLHSLFQLPFSPYVPGTNLLKSSGFKFTKNKIKLLNSIDLLVIDEISMVRADLLDAVDAVLRRYRYRHLPFGGVQLLLIGDLQQLSPVAKPDEWNLLREHYETPYFFSSKALAQTDYATIELKQTYRQTDPAFLEILNQVRANQITPQTLQQLNERYIPNFRPNKNQRYVHLTTHNFQAQNINNRELNLIDAPEYSYKASTKGDFSENLFPADDVLTLKKGAQVMFIKNDPTKEKRYYNGMIGEVVEISKSGFSVKAADTSEIIKVEPAVWTNNRYTFDEKENEIKEEVLGTFTQFPIRTAWAITIHKSQGLTFTHAIIDAQASFAHGQVYVALSRLKTLEGMVLSAPIRPGSIITDQMVNNFTLSNAQNLPEDTQLQQWEHDFYLSKCSELFDFSSIQHAMAAVLSLLQQHFQQLTPKLLQQYQEQTANVYERMIVVADRFKVQYTRLASENSDLQNEKLQERFRQAAAYFLSELETLAPLLQGNTLPTDNKEHKTKYKELTEELAKNVVLKLKLMEHTKEQGFQPQEYVRLHSVLSMSALSVETDNIEKEGKKDKKRKEKKQLEVSTDILHPELYQILTHWRKQRADELNRPAYAVIQQKALLGMVNLLPHDMEELIAIPYFGKASAEAYGEEILSIISAYVANHRVERPQFVYKEVNESKPKVSTHQQSFELFQKGLSIEAIAQQRVLTVSTVLSHLVKFIPTGDITIEKLLSEEKIKTLQTAYGALLPHLKGKKVSFKEVFKEMRSLPALEGFNYSEIEAYLKEKEQLADEI